MIASVVQLWRPRAADRGLALTLNVDRSVPAFAAVDAHRVRQCINNLVSNAIKFTETGSVAIAVERGPDDTLVFTVADTGVGMAPETLERIFSPYTQASASTARRYGGTGLGLSITRRLAEAMGGTVTAQSALGQGSTFTLTIAAPIADRPVAEAEPTASLPRPGARVLVVDDNPLNLQIIQALLEPFDLSLTEALDGPSALQAFESAPVDVVLMDINMPDMDGYQAAASLRASQVAWSDAPIIALTADARGPDQSRSEAAELTDWLTKPIDVRRLLTSLVLVMGDNQSLDADPAESASG